MKNRPLPPADELGRLSEPLTPIDRRVLDALPANGRARRLPAIVEGANRGLDQWSAQRTTEGEALGILRGLEHLGRVAHNRGWWRRMDTMSPERTA